MFKYVKWVVVFMIAFIFMTNQFEKNVHAENPNITVSVDIGLEGKVKSGKGFPIIITIDNKGESFSGNLLLDYYPSYNTGGTKAIKVDLEENSSKTIYTTLPGISEDHANNSKATIRLYKGNWQDGEEISFKGDKRFKTSYLLSSTLGILSKNDDRLKGLQSFNEEIETFSLNKETLPHSSVGLEVIDFLLIDDFPISELATSQQSAIFHWIRNGGVLIAGASSNENRTYGSLYKELPMKWEKKLNTSGSFLEKYGVKEPVNELDIFTGKVDDHATVITKNNSLPMVIKKNIGNGAIIQTAFSLGDEPFSTWNEYSNWFEQFLYNSIDKSVYIGMDQGSYLYDELYYQFAEANEYFSGSIFSVAFLVVILIVYLIVIVPVLYFILKKIDKREYTWWIIPTISILLSVGMFIIGAKDRLGKPSLNGMGFYEVKEGYLSGYQASTLLSDQSGSYKISIPKNNYQAVGNTLNVSGSNAIVMKEEKDLNEVIFPKVEYWSTRSIFGKTSREIEEGFEVNLSIVGNNIKGTIQNHLPYDFEELFIWSGNENINLGAIKSGDSLNVNKEMNKSLLIGPYHQDDMLSTNRNDLTEMKKETLQNASISYFNQQKSDNLPLIAGFTKQSIVEVDLVGNEEKEKNINLIVQPFEIRGEIIGDFTLTNDMLESSFKVIDGKVLESKQFPNEMMIEDGEYEYILTLPKQINIKKLNLETLALKSNTNNVNYRFYNYEKQTFIKVSKDDVIFNKDDIPKQFLSNKGEIRVKLMKKSDGDPYIVLPTITLKGEIES